MPRVTVYRSTPLSLPLEARRTRRFLDKRSHIKGKPSLGDDDYAQFEQRAIFHDVFLQGADLCAVGPPLLNLSRVVMPFRLRIQQPNGSMSDLLKHRVINGERVAIHRFRLPTGLHDVPETRASIDLATGQHAVLSVARTRLSPVFLQFTAMQKNSPFDWIADWLEHAARTGVDRVLLYDNGSDDVDALPARLQALAVAPEIVLVRWPYAYGPIRSVYNRFCQPSQINHAHRCFGASEWCGNFDLDEYPVAGEGTSLVTHLRACSARTGLLRLDSYWVPRVGDASRTSAYRHDGVPTARDFRYRDRRVRGAARKYLVRHRALREPRLHDARLRLGWWRQRADPDDLAFLHYKALTTGWNTDGDRQGSEAVDPSRHVQDLRVQRSLSTIERPDAPAPDLRVSSPSNARPEDEIT